MSFFSTYNEKTFYVWEWTSPNSLLISILPSFRTCSFLHWQPAYWQAVNINKLTPTMVTYNIIRRYFTDLLSCMYLRSCILSEETWQYKNSKNGGECFIYAYKKQSMLYNIECATLPCITALFHFPL